jgi:hypothetical protein
MEWGEAKADVPNLELDHLAIELDGADLKVNTNGGNVALGVRVVSKADEEAGLADARVANDDELEQVVVLRVSGEAHPAGRRKSGGRVWM